VSVETGALSASSCAAATADAHIWQPQDIGFPNEVSVASPTTYNTCYKAYVVDIHHNEANLGLPTENWQKQVTVTWDGPIPRTQAECDDLEGRATCTTTMTAR